MELEELVLGVKKVNLEELKEVKVKLPLRLIVNLHYLRLTQARQISDLVNEALSQYFAGMPSSRLRSPFDPPKPGTNPEFRPGRDGPPAPGMVLVTPSLVSDAGQTASAVSTPGPQAST